VLLTGNGFFYDGQQLVLGAPPRTKAELVYGSNLEHFTVALQVRPAKFQMLSYDYLNNEVGTSKPKNVAGIAGLNEFCQGMLQKSEQFYQHSRPKQWQNHLLLSKQQLEGHANRHAAFQSSNMVRFNGSSDHPGVQIGKNVSVQGKNASNGIEEFLGEYTVVSVNHYCDDLGNYTNEFEAIPAAVKVPPVAISKEPICETQTAIVTDNHDGKGLGRVRVRFHWMEDTEKSPWLRVATPHAGGGKGMFLLPEVGEEVIVGFEGDSPTKPYVIGSVYHGKAKCSFGNGGNDVKALQSRSGNKVVLNDKNGSITIADSSGNRIVMHGNGEITIHAPKKMTISSPDIILAAKNSIRIAVGGNEEVPAPTVSFVMDNVSQSAAIMAKQTLSLTSELDMSINSTQTLNADTQELTINGSTTASISAGNLAIDGGSKATISSAATNIF
jgi:uncharacterized protein involved in type VI secretion and phage assembly